MSKPDISVIVANYNHAEYIGEAIESIMFQTKQDFEIIIVDDCSTDNSKSIIRQIINKWDSEKIREPIFLDENRGKWFALNTAIAVAQAPLVTLQDADDASVPQRLERQYYIIKEFKSFHNLSGFTHCYNNVDMARARDWKASKLGYNVIEHTDVLKNAYKGFKSTNINHFYAGIDYEIHGASSMFYKQLWDHGFKFLPNELGLLLAPGEDSDHNLRLCLNMQKTSILKEPLYCYRRGSSTNPSWKLPK